MPTLAPFGRIVQRGVFRFVWHLGALWLAAALGPCFLTCLSPSGLEAAAGENLIPTAFRVDRESELARKRGDEAAQSGLPNRGSDAHSLEGKVAQPKPLSKADR